MRAERSYAPLLARLKNATTAFFNGLISWFARRWQLWRLKGQRGDVKIRIESPRPMGQFPSQFSERLSMPGAPAQPKMNAPPGAAGRGDVWRAVAIGILLVVGCLLFYSPTLRQGFSCVDDPVFIYNEPHVMQGLSWSGLRWAFTNGPWGEWYPLSMLSHMLDCQLYGKEPAGHHLTNVVLHALSSLVLFLVLWRMTGSLWPSAAVAALFAFHPLHVEPVALLAQRRDVLSGLFFALCLGAYDEFTRHPRSLGRYLVVALMLTLGLMAKSILVTVPRAAGAARCLAAATVRRA